MANIVDIVNDREGELTVSSLDLAEQCYKEYGEYINQFRLIPHACDGTISVYRRSMLAANGYKKLTKTAAIVADTIRDWHPHGDASVVPVITKLVRRGILKGQGNWGVTLMENIPAAAPRYTEACSKPEVTKALMDLTGYAPHFENELGNKEPAYLITPIPLALVYGHMGMGLGCSTRIPAFTYESLVEAYVKDDPTKLRLQYGYSLEGGELLDLWLTGTGRLGMGIKCTYEWSEEDEGHVTVIEGSGEMMKPALGLLDDYAETGRVFIRDESTKHIRLVVGRTKGTRMISDDRIYEICKMASTKMRKFDIKVFLNGKVRRIGIRDWLHLTMKNYSDSFEKRQIDQTKSTKDKIFHYHLIDPVAKKLQKEESDESILEYLNGTWLSRNKEVPFCREVTMDDVRSISGRSLKNLRSLDLESSVAKAQAELAEIESFTVQESIDNVSSALHLNFEY